MLPSADGEFWRDGSVNLLQHLLRGLLLLGGFALALLAFLVAWWLALLLLAGFLVYAWLRGGRSPVSGRRAGPTVIEGDFTVERDGEADRRRPPQ